jgi:hypothetical protein
MLIVLPVTVSADMGIGNGNYRLSTKGAKWWVQFPVSDYELQNKRISIDGKSFYYMFSNKINGLNVSFFIEEANMCTNSEACRDMFWSNPGPMVVNPQYVKKYNLNNFAIVEYCLINLKFQGQNLDQMNISGHIVKGGYWIDMHISKVQLKDTDISLFHNFIDSISFQQR